MKKAKLVGILLAAALALCCQTTAQAGKSTAALRRTAAPEGTVWLDELVGSDTHMGLTMKKSITNGPIIIAGVIFPHGFGAFPGGMLSVNLNGAAQGFKAAVGVNDFSGSKDGKVNFEVWVDGEKAAESGPVGFGEEPMALSVGLKGAKKLYLVVTGDENGRQAADWGGALLALDPNAAGRPEMTVKDDKTEPEIAHADMTTPGIHGARAVGSTPGKPFLFRIPATGEAPLHFAAEGLPEGLSLDENTGIIAGSLKGDGEWFATLTVKAANGTASRKLKIVGGQSRLAQTPPMGWNSWNAWGTAVNDEKVRSAADAMSASGLAQYGFMFVNIDDAWEAGRDENGEIVANEKFPDMKALADYVHAKGLKLGVYSSPGPYTCARYEGTYQHEYQDAETYAKWGVDYLKYDWCGYRDIAKDDSLEEHMKPYKLMKKALDAAPRDITFSMCQYGMKDVWEWGAEAGGNLWRTTGDINDTWGSMSSIGFGQSNLWPHAGPGHWNDPDMLVVGKVGWGPSLHPTRLTPNEQLTHITLWSMLAAPLLIGCDMADMDSFTLDVLTNGEVLDVNQDPLGRQAKRVASQDILAEVWARPLFDGTQAAAFFNRFIEPQEITVDWSDLGIEGQQPVRNLWLKKDLGEFDGSLTVTVPPHGAALVKIGKPEPGEWGK